MEESKPCKGGRDFCFKLRLYGKMICKYCIFDYTGGRIIVERE